jgi:hypothetical protein
VQLRSVHCVTVVLLVLMRNIVAVLEAFSRVDISRVTASGRVYRGNSSVSTAVTVVVTVIVLVAAIVVSAEAVVIL